MPFSSSDLSAPPDSDTLELSSDHEAKAGTDVVDDDTVSGCMARILEIIPDVEPDYLVKLITDSILTYGPGAGIVEYVLHTLFDDPKFPRVRKKAKEKEDFDINTEQDSHKEKVVSGLNYGDHNRPFTGGPNYADLTIEHLKEDFPLIPPGFMTVSLRSLSGLYAPTHLFLLEQYKKYEVAKRKKIKLPFLQLRLLPRSRSRLLHPCTLNKDISLEKPQDEEFSRERAWLIQEVMDRAGSGIECGCCFATFRFHEMVQCPDMHLFCITCMTSYASTLLGVHDPRIQCMDRSGCSALIPESEMRRFLSEKMVRLWERVSQRKEVMDAKLERLEECPFCDYGMVIENDEEKLFRCGNEEVCGVVSCRACKKPDHLPIHCEDVEEDSILDGRHTIEEAMSRALVRNCPKCQKPFVKEIGCNVMTCPSAGCGAQSCYVCRRLIDSHAHINSGPCSTAPLVEVLHANNVKEARQRAFEEYKRDHPEIDEERIKVDLPGSITVPLVSPTAPLPGFDAYY